MTRIIGSSSAAAATFSKQKPFAEIATKARIFFTLETMARANFPF
jgi:hypothetical protein